MPSRRFLLDLKFGFWIILLFCDTFGELWHCLSGSVTWGKVVSWSGKLHRPPKEDGLNLPYQLLQPTLKSQKSSNWQHILKKWRVSDWLCIFWMHTAFQTRGQNHIDEPEINIRICPFVNTQKGSWCILSQPEESKACITVYFLEAGRCQNSKMRSPFLTIPVPDAFVAALCPEEKKRMLSIIFAGWSKDRTTEGAENTHVRQAEILQLELLRSGKVKRHYLLPSDGLQTMCLRMTISTLQVYPASRGRLEKHNIAFIKKVFPKKNSEK